MAKKIKITRKQIKQPDDFLSWSENAWNWIEDNTWQVTGIVLGVIVVFLLIQGGIYWAKGQGDSPRLALSAAMNTLYEPVVPEDESLVPGMARGFRSEREKQEVIANLFESIITDHPDTVEARLSVIYAARSYEKLEEYDKSIDYYNKFAESELSTMVPDLKESSLLGVARSYYSQGQFSKSLEYLNKIIESKSAFRLDAMILGARCHFKMNEEEKANEILGKLNSEFPEAWLSQPADFLAEYWTNRDEIIKEGQRIKEENLNKGEVVTGDTLAEDEDKTEDDVESETETGTTTPK